MQQEVEKLSGLYDLFCASISGERVVCTPVPPDAGRRILKEEESPGFVIDDLERPRVLVVGRIGDGSAREDQIRFVQAWFSPIGLKRGENLSFCAVNRTGDALVEAIREKKPAVIAVLGDLEIDRTKLQGFQIRSILHPDRVLGDASLKRPVWNSVKEIASFLDLPILRGR